MKDTEPEIGCTNVKHWKPVSPVLGFMDWIIFSTVERSSEVCMHFFRQSSCFFLPRVIHQVWTSFLLWILTRPIYTPCQFRFSVIQAREVLGTQIKGSWTSFSVLGGIFSLIGKGYLLSKNSFCSACNIFLFVFSEIRDKHLIHSWLYQLRNISKLCPIICSLYKTLLQRSLSDPPTHFCRLPIKFRIQLKVLAFIFWALDGETSIFIRTLVALCHQQDSQFFWPELVIHS